MTREGLSDDYVEVELEVELRRCYFCGDKFEKLELDTDKDKICEYCLCWPKQEFESENHSEK